MNLDDILELAAARTPSSLDRARTRRAAERVLREYAESTAEGRNVLGDLDVADVLAPEADEASRITRVAQSTKTGWVKWIAATGELTWSDEMSRLFGYPAVTTHIPVDRLIKGVHQEDFTRVNELIEQGWRHRIPQEFTFRVLRADGAMRYAGCLVELLSDDGREPTGIVATVRDITRQELERQEIDRRRRRRETEAADLPGRDPVCGMLGRDRFADELDRVARSGQGTLLVMAVEPDRTLSDAQGEQVTRTVAGILDEIVDNSDFCGALGSGEFGLVLGDVGHARDVAEAVLGCLHQRLTLTISTGVRLRAWAALVPFARADRASGQDLLLDASWAWRDGRRGGDMLTELPAPRDAATREATTRREIAAVLSTDRLRLYAQPILDLTLNEITRHEILLRVLDENGRTEPPAAFLAVAERFDQIGAIDQWVVENSLALIGQGPQTSHHQINLSGAHAVPARARRVRDRDHRPLRCRPADDHLRDHRVGGRRQPRRRGRVRGRGAQPGMRARTRRLRHRTLVAVAAQVPADRSGQDRWGLRDRAARLGVRPDRRPERGAHVPRARRTDGRGVRRGRCDGGPAAGHGSGLRPGLRHRAAVPDAGNAGRGRAPCAVRGGKVGHRLSAVSRVRAPGPTRPHPPSGTYAAPRPAR